MRKNHLGQYVSKGGRFIVVPRWCENQQEGYYLHDLETGKRKKVKTLKEAREIVKKKEK